MTPASILKYAVLLMGLTGLGFFLLVGIPKSPRLSPDLVGMMAGSPKELAPFQLVDHGGKPFDRDSLKGRFTLIFFGYAHCPDICPLAMDDMKEIFAILEKSSLTTARSSRGVFVSVDPKRDTPEMLANYVTFFNKGFLGVTGTETALLDFSRQVGAGYRILPGKSADDYLVAHTSNFYLIDPQGQFITYFNAPHDPAAIAAKLVAIRQAYGDPL